MQDFADMAEAHEWTLRRLREMAGRLTEQAYQRACAAQTPEDGYDAEAAQRWMLVFDRMARGLRLTVALEAKLARERRSDAAKIAEEIGPRVVREAHTRRAAVAASAEADPSECDAECDDDGLPADAPLGQRITRLRAIVEGAVRPEPRTEPRPRTVFAWGVGRDAALAPPEASAETERTDRPWRGSG